MYAVLDKKGGLRNPENQSRFETRLVIRPFTVKENCQISSLASIRKGLGRENTPFLVSSYSIIASKNISGRVLVENFKSPGKAIVTNPEGSQAGRVPYFANPVGSQFCQHGGVLFLPIPKGSIFANPEGSYFCQSGRVLFLPTRRGPILPIRKGPFLPIRKSPIFANPEGCYFCQS